MKISKVAMIEEEIKMLEEWYIGELIKISRELKAAKNPAQRFEHGH